MALEKNNSSRIALGALFLLLALFAGTAFSACTLANGAACSFSDPKLCCSPELICSGEKQTCCLPSGSPKNCIDGKECCSGFCDGGLCVSGLACGHECKVSSDCGMECPMCLDDAGKKACGSCIAEKSASECSTDSQCCEGLFCSSESKNKCVSCLIAGDFCSVHSSCCSGTCELQQDGARRCTSPFTPQTCTRLPNATIPIPGSSNWVSVGAASFTVSAAQVHSGTLALLASATQSIANANASYAYRTGIIMDNGSTYLLEFWANDTIRYAIYDAGNDAYLNGAGAWVPACSAGNEKPTILSTNIASGAYRYFSRTFTTPGSKVSNVQLRFYPKYNGGAAGLDDVSITKLNDFSQFAWIRPGANSNGIVFSQMGAEDGSPQGFYWQLSGGDRLTLNYASARNATGSSASITSEIALPQDGNWHHVGITAIRRGDYATYLDGVQVSSGAFSKLGRLNNSAPFTIGKSASGASFNGSLDEVRFYQRALLPQEISALYSGDKYGKCSIISAFNYNEPLLASASLAPTYNAQLRIRSLPSSAVLSMPFDANISSSATGAVTDYSRYGLHGTVLQAAWTPDGKYGGAYYVNGSKNSSIYICSGCLSNLQYYTATAWVKLDYSAGSGDDYYSILSGDTSPGSSGLNMLVQKSDGHLGALCGSGTATFTSLAVPGYEWAFVAVRGFRNATGGFVDVSVNGDKWSRVCTGTSASALSDSTAYYIGAKNQNEYRAKGTIDEVRVFNSALSQEELSSLYNERSTVYSGKISTPAVISAPLSVNGSNLPYTGIVCGNSTCGESSPYCCEMGAAPFCYNNVTTFCNAGVICNESICGSSQYCCPGLGCLANNDVSCGCRELNESGDFILTHNVTANESIIENRACYEVTANNVQLDCQLNTITRPTRGMPDGWGISSAANRTTIKNCGIYFGFNGGISFSGVNGGQVNTVKVVAANSPAVSLVGSPNSRITLLSSSSSAYATVYVSDSPNANISAATISCDGYGSALYAQNSPNTNISNTVATSVNGTGIVLRTSDGSTVTNTAASSNTSNGFEMYSSSKVSISGLNASTNYSKGIVLYDSYNNNISNSIALANAIPHSVQDTYNVCGPYTGDETLSNIADSICRYALGLVRSSNNSIADTNVSALYAAGTLIMDGYDNNFTKVNISTYDMKQGPPAIAIGRSDRNNFTNILIDSEGRGVDMDSCSKNSFSKLTSESQYFGFYAYKSINNTISESNISTHMSVGVSFLSSANNRLIGSRVYSPYSSAIVIGGIFNTDYPEMNLLAGSSNNSIINSIAISDDMGTAEAGWGGFVNYHPEGLDLWLTWIPGTGWVSGGPTNPGPWYYSDEYEIQRGGVLRISPFSYDNSIINTTVIFTSGNYNPLSTYESCAIGIRSPRTTLVNSTAISVRGDAICILNVSNMVLSNMNAVANHSSIDDSNYAISLISCSNITIANTTITNSSDSGISLESSSNNKIDNVTIDVRSNPFYLNNSDFNTISNCKGNSTGINGLSYGFSSEYSDSNVISNSNFSSTTVGMNFLGSNSNTLINSNVMVSSGSLSGLGIYLTGSNNQILNSRINSSGGGLLIPTYYSYYFACEHNYTYKSDNNSIVDSRISSGTDGVNIKDANNLSIFSSNITSNSSNGIWLAGVTNSTINNSRINGTGAAILVNTCLDAGSNSIIHTSQYNVINNSVLPATTLSSVLNTTIANSIIDKITINRVDPTTSYSLYNTFRNNTFTNKTSSLVSLTYAGNNLFYWNNFTNTSGLYISCTNAVQPNQFNTTMNGHGEGNIWSNVINGSVQIISGASSSYGGGWFVGSSGSGYPYNNTTSQGKISPLCGANVVDWAPLRR